jgi:hypothetical protein
MFRVPLVCLLSNGGYARHPSSYLYSKFWGGIEFSAHAMYLEQVFRSDLLKAAMASVVATRAEGPRDRSSRRGSSIQIAIDR